MIRVIKTIVVSVVVGLYLGVGATGGIISILEIKKLKEEVTILQYEMGVISASDNSK